MTYSSRVLAECEPEDLEVFKEEGLTEDPKDYYFAADANYVYIVPKLCFDGTGYWSDSGYIGFLLENHLQGFSEALEAHFEWDGAGQRPSLDTIKEDLKKRGFTENNALMSSNDDDEEENG